MVLLHCFLAFLIRLSVASASHSHRPLIRDTGSNHVSLLEIPKYVVPAADREITEWFAIGDSFSTGIGADAPGDLLNEACYRFKESFPNQMNQDPRLPGKFASRKFAFASCPSAIGDQIDALLPNTNANFPKLEKPQIGTVSLLWDEIGLEDVWNSCVYQWVGNRTCNSTVTHTLDLLNEGKAGITGFNISEVIRNDLKLILNKGRAANPSFQLYVMEHLQPWNEDSKQCNNVSWGRPYRAPVFLDHDVRFNMNFLVYYLNVVTEKIVSSLSAEISGGLYYVWEFNPKFEGHRFCEEESDLSYHMMPTADRTWFHHHKSPYGGLLPVKETNQSNFFDVVDSILIPEKDGKTTDDQIKAVNGNLSKLNSAYDNISSMKNALINLAQQDARYKDFPMLWARIMHPKGSGHKEISNVIIDQILENVGPVDPKYPQGLECTQTNVKKFLRREDLSSRITEFCKTAANQKEHDRDSGSISRTYSPGTRSEVSLSIEWPQKYNISKNMEASCVNNMTKIKDGCGGNDPKNPLNWKRGGRLGAGWVNYKIEPKFDQGYTPGTCVVNFRENDYWEGVNGPGTERKDDFTIEQLTIKDAAGNIIGDAGFAPNKKDGASISASNSNALNVYSKLPDVLVITPEARNDYYIQFAIGPQNWQTTTDTGGANCDNTKKWVSSGFNIRYRDVECTFEC
ncbi:SGNH hydrolase-type esterase domain-containing protein [Xylaria bambusicola]|uniref:SGNH hydrolase-type esterase domain-containing protein n=1 Tax=Xylaria bambusicola TaxID=326684 RepID=UPI0020080664|nr:SGNH hydrolase-type esterase domain-containing protein [Xylaria bambusicola]KAI0520844.1 SGNH hydrolase-type esterase domain-containing protein [Xylaria bambusicola]